MPSSDTFIPEKFQYTVQNIPQIISAISNIAQTLITNYHTAVNMDGVDKNDPFFTRLRTILSSNFAIPEAKDKDWHSLIHEILSSIIKVQNYAAASVRDRRTEAFTGHLKTFFNNEDKSFATLQILLKNGYLDNKTLLIIDEPEAHLHPQWIVEYARIITLLNKELGVKFLIASHNPDMISALKYISEKEKVTENLNFYLAEKAEEETYTYRALAISTGYS